MVDCLGRKVQTSKNSTERRGQPDTSEQKLYRSSRAPAIQESPYLPWQNRRSVFCGPCICPPVAACGFFGRFTFERHGQLPRSTLLISKYEFRPRSRPGSVPCSPWNTVRLE